MRSSGMFPPESNLIPVQQQVLQEFYEEHGLPNEAEKDLLMVALRVDRESIELWFKTKVYHLRAYLTLRNRLKLSCKPSDERRRMALMLTEEYGEKDFFHH
ncbi:MAG: hypothetical protein LQ342_001039 [Letrouitia transgressa]|nr:MAG: hypothetical protein LQ342_001039 [Letrouitia transgressa]